MKIKWLNPVKCFASTLLNFTGQLVEWLNDYYEISVICVNN